MTSKLYDKITVSHSSDAKTSYLVLQVGKHEKIIKHQVTTLAKNPVHTILQFKIIPKDDIMSFYYDITSKQTLAQTLKRKKFSKTEITDILIKICRVIIDCDNYYLHENNFLVSEDYIYINPATLEISLVYIPLELSGKQLNTEFYRLVNKLISNIDNTRGANSDFVHQTLVEINVEPFNFPQFSQYLAEVIVGGKDEPPAIESRAVYRTSENKREPLLQEPPARQPEQKSKKVLKKQTVTHQPSQQNIPQEENIAKGQDDKKKKTVIILLVQVLLLIGLALVTLETNLIIDQAGVLDLTTLAALVLIVGAVDILIVKKLLAGEESRTAEEKVKKQKQNNSKVKSKSKSKPRKQIKMPSKKDAKIAKIIPRERDSEPDSENFATVLMDSGPDTEKGAYVSQVVNGEMKKIKISNNPFMIGKLRGQVDFLVDSSTVSRIHAEICREDETYYIVDLNSRNGTYLNGEKIQSNTRYQLKNGDMLTFAREEVTFIL
ncbi:FHA domain-containing protein [candidate division NPL-UPA2 bacterium]|nr:FHA domain-containing protein [candidate division NPL-UPA2 bacterium]